MDYNHPEIIKYLIENYLDSFDSEELNEWLSTVSHYENLENVKYLVEHGADPESWIVRCD